MSATHKWGALLVTITAVLVSLPGNGQAQSSQSSSQDKIYKYRDAQGNVRYSDQPQAGAKEITVAPVTTTFTPTSADTPNILTPSPDDTSEVPVNQVSLQVIEPSVEQAIRANNGTGEFRWRADAERLTSSLVYRLVLDNVLVYEGEIPQVTLENLDRGAHEFVIEAYLANQPLSAANRLTETAPRTFYLQRHSRLFPNGTN